MASGERQYAFDVVRVIAMVFVVGVHSLMVVDTTWVGGAFYETVGQSLMFTANALFFLLSGKFNLRERKTDEDLKRYYFKRARNFLLPILVLFFVRTLYNCFPFSDGPIAVFKEFVRSSLGTFSSMEYWFVFSLFGYLLAAPFIAHGLVHATAFAKRCFMVIGFGYCTCVFVFGNLGIEFSWGYLFAGFAFTFALGAFADELSHTKKGARRIGLIGLVGFALTVFFAWSGWRVGVFDVSPFYTVAALGLYGVILYAFRNAKPSRAVSFLAQHSFSVYLIHMMVLMPLARSLPPLEGAASLLGHIGVTAVVFGITLVLAIVADAVLVKPCQRLFDKVTGKLLCSI